MSNNYSFEAIYFYIQIFPFWLINNLYYLVYLFIPLLVIVGLVIFRRGWNIKEILKQEYVLLELTPPATTEKTAYTTQQLFSVIHSLGMQKSFKDKFFGRKTLFTFEIVSTHEKGIRFLLRANTKDVKNIKRSIMSYLPFVEVKEVEDYLTLHDTNKSKVTELQLSRHYAYPLRKQDVLEEHDPVAYITGMMTKLKKEEFISFQIVLTPTERKETKALSKMILRQDDVLRRLDTLQIPSFLSPISFIFIFLIKALEICGNQLQWALLELTRDTNKRTSSGNIANYQAQQIINLSKPARVISSFEQNAISSVKDKIEQSLFETSLRLLVSVKDPTDQKERLNGFVSSIATFSVPKGQSLKKKYSLLPNLTDKIRVISFKNRLLSLFSNSSSTVLSVSEISDLYHFPFANVAQTENIVKIHSKELPAPLSLKNNPTLDISFAKNMYGGSETMIGLTKKERERHIYVIGATGTGKTTLLLSMINQDLNNGKGVCVIDPHGDLAETAINCIPEERMKDLIYFNPYDIKYPIGVNLLELTPGLSEEDSLLEKEFIAESVISLFRKMFSDGTSTHPHRIEYILRNTIHTAFTLESPTLFTIFELLNNPHFQKKAVAGLTDENLRNFWKYEFGKAGDFQRVKMVSPVTSRIGRLLFSPSAKRIFEQEKSTINFDEILDNKKILICNLSKGNIGEDTSEVMGIMLLNKIQLAALKRSRVEQTKRNAFYLYVDEFQNFATPSFVQMLSESRKYGLSLTMAEQSTSQQKDKNLVQIVLANTGTVVTFRSANPEDEKLLLPQYRPYVEEGEITNLPSFHFYIKTAALHPEEPFSGVTIPLAITEDKEKMKRFISSSRVNYAVEYKSKSTMESKQKKKEVRFQENTRAQISKTGLPI